VQCVAAYHEFSCACVQCVLLVAHAARIQSEISHVNFGKPVEKNTEIFSAVGTVELQSAQKLH
jgi:hypothetical protein